MKSKVLKYLFCVLFFISFSSYGQEIVHDPIQTAAVLASLAEQLQQLKDAVKSLTSFNWNNPGNAAQLQSLESYLQQSGSLALSANSVDAEFQHYFPGYKPPEGSDYSTQYSHIMGDANTALKSVMQVMASINNQSDPMNQNANLSNIQMQISNAQNPVQATQGLSQITAQLASNLEVLQKTVAAQASAQDAYYAVQLQTQATKQAELDKVIKAGSTNVPAYGSSGNYLRVPNF